MPKLKKTIVQAYRRFCYRNEIVWAPEQASDALSAAIRSQLPFSFGKLGNVESNAVDFYMHRSKDENLSTSNWGKIGHKLYKNAGVFPEENHSFKEFCSAYIGALKEMDVLGIWYHRTEWRVIRQYAAQAQLCDYLVLSPEPGAHLSNYWTSYLTGKRVLVVHPFTQTIESQYLRRELIWPKYPHLLPEFELSTIKTPLAASITPSKYKSWHLGLEDLKKQMAQKDFDIALIGAGAWSLPLTIHAKKLGKVGIHTGGATQLFFGIKGNRWEKHQEPSFYNAHWTRPSSSETPENAHKVEKACYW